MTPLLKFEITVCFSCQSIHGQWRGLISRNGSVWPILFLFDVLGNYNYILLGILRSTLATIVDVFKSVHSLSYISDSNAKLYEYLQFQLSPYM